MELNQPPTSSLWCSQGSALGPLLFLVYIDGVCSSVTASKITFMLMVIAIYKNIRSQSDYTALQGDVTSVCDWIDNNHLKLNLQKCCYFLKSVALMYPLLLATLMPLMKR